MGDTSESVVIGILYPPEWYGDADALAAEVARLEAIDPRLQVIAEGYVESEELRTARGKPDAGELPEAPTLTDAQREALSRVQVAITLDLPSDVGTLAPNLRWVQAVGAGTSQLQPVLTEAGVRLTSSAGANAVGIAEFVIGRVIQHWKGFRVLDEQQQAHVWRARYGRQLAGCTLGLIGLGAINAAVASHAQAFDMHVIATRRSATRGATAPDVDELFPHGALHAMLGQADAVVAAVPETPETVGMMDAAAFAAMQPGAFFCNVGRGSFVDEAALAEALRNGHLSGAAIDVAGVEPLPPGHELWDAPNLFLSPHSAASPQAMFVNLHELFRENLARYLAGEPLVNEVDLGRGY